MRTRSLKPRPLRKAIVWVFAVSFAVIAFTAAMGFSQEHRPSGTPANPVAYQECLAQLYTAVHCANVAIVDGQVSEQAWDALLESGWAGDPSDGREALYPPVIHEDDPRWDCATMGNRICGPGALRPVAGEVR